jgi:hypothetical protein
VRGALNSRKRRFLARAVGHLLRVAGYSCHYGGKHIDAGRAVVTNGFLAADCHSSRTPYTNLSGVSEAG